MQTRPLLRPATWSDILRFLGLATMLGLAAGLLLGSMALVLAVPAYANERPRTDSVWIHAKAMGAKVLVALAWERSIAQQTPVRPWPWADTWPMARLTVPRLGVHQYVLAGADGPALNLGPAHVHGTTEPGEAGNSVIAGHRDTHFSFLRDVRIGDALVIQRIDGSSVRYRIGDASILDRKSVWIMEQAGPSRLTLVTYPFDALGAGDPARYVLLAFLS